MVDNEIITLDNISAYNITKQEYRLIEKYIETLDYIESFDYAGYLVPNTQEDINEYKRRYAKRMLQKPPVALVLKELSTKVMTANTANAQEVLWFFTQVMRGNVKDQFGLDAPLSERLKAAIELAKRTVDIANKASTDNEIHISLDWHRA